MTLRGPADPDRFRTKVGRYGTRWYIDGLPACELAAPMDDPVPAVSTVGGAWPKFLTKWAAENAARCAVDESDTWKSMERQAAIDYIAKAPDRARDKAANRGTQLHAVIETIAAGHEPALGLMPEAEPYLPAVHKMLDELQPTFVLSEAVALNRHLRYAGTLDAVVDIAGEGRFLVDFKTREKHNAYDDECAKTAGYTMAEYVIVEQDGHPVRAPMPAVDGAGIITITPDGWEFHDIALDEARMAWATVVEFWWAKGRKIVNGVRHFAPRTVVENPPAPVPQITIETPAPTPERFEWIKERVRGLYEVHPAEVEKLWPEGVATFRNGGPTTEAEVDRLDKMCSWIEREHTEPFPEPGPDLRADIVDPASGVAVDLLTRCEKLPADIAENLTAQAATEELGSLRAGLPVEHLSRVTKLVEMAEAAHELRKGRVASQLQDVDDWSPLEAEVGGSVESWTEAQMERAFALASALRVGLVQSAGASLIATDDALVALVDAYDGKAKLLAAAKEIADTLEIDRPRSAAAACGEPQIVAELLRQAA